jgi:hypothetical protein
VPSPNQARHNRKKASKRQGGFCFWCEVPLVQPTQGTHSDRQCTAEHLIPRAKGGTNDKLNIVAACQRCNGNRGDQPIEQWLVRVKLRLEKEGNPQHFEVILQRLRERGIHAPIGQPLSGPDGHNPLTVPPPKDPEQAPQG